MLSCTSFSCSTGDILRRHSRVRAQCFMPRRSQLMVCAPTAHGRHIDWQPPSGGGLGERGRHEGAGVWQVTSLHATTDAYLKPQGTSVHYNHSFLGVAQGCWLPSRRPADPVAVVVHSPQSTVIHGHCDPRHRPRAECLRPSAPHLQHALRLLERRLRVHQHRDAARHQLVRVPLLRTAPSCLVKSRLAPIVGR